MATRVQLNLASERLIAAAQWAEQVQVANFDTIVYEDEPRLLMYIRVLLEQAMSKVQGQVDKSRLELIERLLHPLQESAEADGRVASLIEIKILQALYHDICGELETAFTFLDEILQLAETQHYIRRFADSGHRLYQLLVQYQTVPRASTVSQEFLSLVRTAFPKSIQHKVTATSTHFDPLTESELTTLRLLASNRSINDIADELSVAVSTIRTYTKRIYSKLDVHSRAEAVYRAKELNLI